MAAIINHLKLGGLEQGNLFGQSEGKKKSEIIIAWLKSKCQQDHTSPVPFRGKILLPRLCLSWIPA
jgi:hypothetical protein